MQSPVAGRAPPTRAGLEDTLHSANLKQDGSARQSRGLLPRRRRHHLLLPDRRCNFYTSPTQRIHTLAKRVTINTCTGTAIHACVSRTCTYLSRIRTPHAAIVALKAYGHDLTETQLSCLPHLFALLPSHWSPFRVLWLTPPVDHRWPPGVCGIEGILSMTLSGLGCAGRASAPFLGAARLRSC